MMVFWLLFGLFLVHGVAGNCTDFVSEGFILVAEETSEVYKMTLDGRSLELWSANFTGVYGGFSLDSKNKKVIIADSADHSVYRANLDGSGIKKILDLSTDGFWIQCLAVDAGAGYIFYGTYEGHIGRMSLDGTSHTYIAQGLGAVGGVAVDSGRQKVYWSEAVPSDRLARMNYDGNQNETLLTTCVDDPYGLSIDTNNGYLYWLDYSLGIVEKSALSGRQRDTLTTIPDSRMAFMSLCGDELFLSDYTTWDPAVVWGLSARGGNRYEFGGYNFFSIASVYVVQLRAVNSADVRVSVYPALLAALILMTQAMN